jgi:membrane protein
MLKHLKTFAELWGRAGAGTHAAATAYFAIFSLAPLVMIAIAIAGLFLGRDQARSAILEQFQATFGSDFRGFAENLVTSQNAGSGIFAAVIGGALILFGASRIATRECCWLAHRNA